MGRRPLHTLRRRLLGPGGRAPYEAAMRRFDHGVEYPRWKLDAESLAVARLFARWHCARRLQPWYRFSLRANPLKMPGGARGSDYVGGGAICFAFTPPGYA